ncbi:MAG: tetratricopeptide repeat protein [Candidatus Hodarchaeales archaeon]
MVISIQDCFSELNWIDLFDTIKDTIKDYIQFDSKHPPAIMHYFNILDYVGADEKYNLLLKSIKNLGFDQKNEFHPFQFIAELLRSINKQYNPELQLKLTNYLTNKKITHPWIQDLLHWLNVYTKIRTGIHQKLKKWYCETEFNFPFWKGRVLQLIVRHSIKTTNWDNFKFYIQEFEKIASDEKYTIFWSAIWNLKGITYHERGMFDEGASFYNKALKEAKRTANRDLEQRLNNNLGITYLDLGDYELAEHFIRHSIAFDTRIDTLATSWNNLGFVLYSKGDLASSYQAYLESQKLLSEIKESMSATGFLKLGLGLHKASQGAIHESFPIFNSALEEFDSFKDIPGQIYLHGIVGHVFYNNREFQLAEIQFHRFLELLESTRSYPTYISYYCIYILCLLDQRKVESASKLLENLQIVATQYPYIRLIGVWYRFVLGTYEYDLSNLSIAEDQFNKAIELTKDKGPYELTLRSILMVIEINLRIYILKAEKELLDKVQSLLSLADRIGTEHPIFPISIYIKLYQAMLAIHSQPESVDEYISEAQAFIQRSGQIALKKRFKAMIDQIESQRHFKIDIHKSLLQALQVSSGRKLIGKTFDFDELGIIAWKLEDEFGPKTLAFSLSKKLIEEERIDVSLMTLGVLLTGILGQGDFYHEGVFGPLPVPTNNHLHCNVASKLLTDSKQTDKRFEGKNFTLVAILYPANEVMDRFSLQEVISDWWTKIHDLTDLDDNETLLDTLKNSISGSVLKIS